MTTILLADDHALLRRGFRMVLESEPDLRVVGEAADGRVARQQVAALAPDVVLMDVRMPGGDGIEATRRIVAEHPATRVLVLTTFDLDEYVFGALRAGAAGFLLKDAPRERLVEAIRVVHAGDALLSPSVTRRLVEDYARRSDPVRPPDDVIRHLTPREREVLVLVARGLNNDEIAAELVVSRATVKTHVSNVLAKLGLRDRVQAVVYAHEHGLVG